MFYDCDYRSAFFCFFLPWNTGEKFTLHCTFLNIFFFIYSLLPQGWVATSTLRCSTLLYNDPAAHQDHCARCRIWTQDLCPRSLVRYQWATTSHLFNIIIVLVSALLIKFGIKLANQFLYQQKCLSKYSLVTDAFLYRTV